MHHWQINVMAESEAALTNGVEVTLNGELWTIHFVESLPPGHEVDEGLCLHEERRILLLQTTDWQVNEECIEHELMHAVFPWMREWLVLRAAREITVAKQKLGFRRNGE